MESRRFEDEEAALDVDNDITTPPADVLWENKTVTMPQGQFRLKFDLDSFRDAFMSRSGPDKEFALGLTNCRNIAQISGSNKRENKANDVCFDAR